MTPEWRAELPHYIEDGDLVVPPDSIFAMGDNRDVSLDSRYWGFVPFENVIGRPMFIYWSFITPRDEYERQIHRRPHRLAVQHRHSLLRSDTLVPDVPRGALMLSRRSRRMMWVVPLVLVLALLVPPLVNVNRYRGRVAGAISQALGREVTVSYITLKLLPRPGLVLSNFVVAEDPSYGAEPMLRADTVTAYLRLTSLWRGRLEIGTLDLDNPSLNLVRRPDGHWNVEELVERTSRATSAPTSRLRPEARPRFPYVEASSGRINFKIGQVKKAFAFTDADFALWLESENQWGIRVEARPVRTDVNITDTGTLKLDGRFQRASNLRDTPLYLKLTFSDGPLGQMTKLLYARDRGWRGTLSSSAILTGTPAALGVTLDAQVDDFRRYDIAIGEALRLRVHCTGTYSSLTTRCMTCVVSRRSAPAFSKFVEMRRAGAAAMS